MIRTCIPRLMALATLGLVATWAQASPASAVGEVTLLIGEARVVRSGGASEPLRRGAAVRVGDRIETAAGGHVFVRVIDNASVSVRPDSSLEIQAYRYDAERPQASEVRLHMERGGSRSISGAATEADKSRFRLNTPIAAIGVRGTDFLVQSERDRVLATVADGAIAVSPLGNGCSAQALGPCAGASLLAADMGRLMVEVRPGDRAARLVPAAEPQVLTAAPAAGPLQGPSAAESAARTAGMMAAEPDAGEIARRNESDAAKVLTLARGNLPQLNRAPEYGTQLSWGRWTFSPVGNDQVSVPYPVASLGRHVTVADDRVGLFRRDDAANPNRLLPEFGGASVDFRLSRAQATFEPSAGAAWGASVDGGQLTIDFGRRTFATLLALSAAGVPATELRTAGDVRPDGTFAVRDEQQRVAGAVSLDGKEAGYLFERSVTGGRFRGTTLWGRP